jgi:hypothetical protein
MTTPTITKQTLALTLFTRQFTTMINAGTSLVRCLATLEEEAPPPYAEAAVTIRGRVEKGATLTKAMEAMPELFPPFYICMCRAGEVGGVLDIALDHLANLLHDDWTLSQTLGVDSMLMSGAQALPENWDELPVPQRTLLLSLFCRAYGMMLSSGVPIIQATMTAADLLPSIQHDAMVQMVEVMRSGADFDAIMEELAFLPPIFRRLYHVGAHTGSLDACLLKLADLYRYQVMYQRMLPVVALENPQDATFVITEEEDMKTDPKRVGVTQRMVKVLLGNALNAGADTVKFVPEAEKGLVVQYGTNGDMHNELTLPMYVQEPLWHFLYLWTDSFGRCEGHVRTQINGQEREVHIAFVTGAQGESVTIQMH